MLKLPKGLKKKKKDKKKKNQELFTEEELEQFKARQLAEQEAAAQRELEQQQSSSASTSKPKTDDDEWSKFNQLTTGIDSILKKTQDELNRIKEESFYQRVPPKPEPVPEPTEVEPEQPILTEEELEEQRRLAALKEAVVELSESESESEAADDIFDTNYIDTLASGELPLAYVPDSPEESDLGPDPFDTNFADKVIKGPEVSKRGKRIVHIGAAVEVLTGRVENVALNKEALRRPRRGPQNLLLESFDQGNNAEDEAAVDEEKSIVEEKPILTLLDDSSDVFADAPIDLSASLHLQYLKQKEEENKEAERIRKELAELQKDEFDELAAESLTKKAEVIVVDPSEILTAPIETEEKGWKSEFEEQAELGIVDVYDDDFADDTDIFDTEFVATVVREKSIEDDDFDPRAGEEPVAEPKKIDNLYAASESNLKVQQKDLLSGSTSDLTHLDRNPVIAASESIEVEIDPFDTSAVSALVQPKETEIKYLEKELLSDSGLKHSISDPDFDPRKDEKPARPPPPSVLAERKSSLVLNIATQHTAAGKSVAFDVGSQLTVGDGDSKKKPVTPYYTEKPIDDISDSEFDPRAVTPADPTNKPDLLSVEADINIKVLTPAEPSNSIDLERDFSVEDPFDTSNVSGVLLPGKAELKLIENEFIEARQTTEKSVLDINSDSQELGLGGKVLTPQITLPEDDSVDDIDPFDTSFASNLGPGKAEIKLLESELIHK